jgi:hypothetical protein
MIFELTEMTEWCESRSFASIDIDIDIDDLFFASLGRPDSWMGQISVRTRESELISPGNIYFCIFVRELD